MKNLSNLLITLALLVMAQVAVAQTTIHTDMTSFMNASNPVMYVETFDGVAPGPAAALSFGPVSGYSYDISTPVGSASGLFNDPGLISTDNNGDAIEVTFTGAPVSAVGGLFFGSDINFGLIPADVVINLSDGTNETYTVASPADAFRGFTTANPSLTITSMTIDADDTLAGTWATIDTLYVGQVPEPATASLLMLSVLGLLGFRRR